MIGSVYNGMSGLLAFSKGLDTISSNISNMNTPGFKSSELQFLDVFYQTQYSSKQNGEIGVSQSGSGVATGGVRTRFGEGEFRSTGQDLDVAIEGVGFFVLRKDNETLYTRAGQLQFDEDGFLISRQNGARIAALDDTNNLHDINQNDFLDIGSEQTTEILFNGVLSTDTENDDGEPIHEVNNIEVIDSLGETRTLRVEFELINSGNREWDVEIFEDDVSLGSGGIRYNSEGAPLTGQNTFEFTLSAENGDESVITINMGDENSPSASKSRSDSILSSLGDSNVDGFSAGALVSSVINDEGILVSEYSNGESREHAQLAIASFLQLQDLEQESSSLFIASDDIQPTFGTAKSDGLGTIRSRTIELSNVELTQQFGDLIIVQRGYQASSQILTVSNEMLQQLIEMRGRG